MTWPGIEPSHFDQRRLANERENGRGTVGRLLRRNERRDHGLLKTKSLARVINHNLKVSQEIVANYAIEPGTDCLTEHGEKISDHDDQIVDSRAAKLE